MFLLSIDPGTENLGWALIRLSDSEVIDYNCEQLIAHKKSTAINIAVNVRRVLDKILEKYGMITNLICETQMRQKFHLVSQSCIMWAIDRGITANLVAAWAVKKHFDIITNGRYDSTKTKEREKVLGLVKWDVNCHEADAILQGWYFCWKQNKSSDIRKSKTKNKKCHLRDSAERAHPINLNLISDMGLTQ